MPQLEPTYLLAALAGVLPYWLLPERARLGWIALISAIALALLDPIALTLLLITTLLLHLSRSALPVVVVVLAFAAVRAGTGPLSELLQLSTPLGFGFAMVRAAHVGLERRAGRLGDVPLLELLVYMLFFPTIVVGPIHRLDVFVRWTRRQRLDPAQIGQGLRRILHGLAKVTVIAGLLISELGVGLLAGIPVESGQAVAVEALLYGLHLYFAFSGYSDLAIGLALLMGYELQENFDWPFIRSNLQDFWASWHRSLTGFCRDYVYTLALARTRSVAVAVFASLMVLSLWHEFSARYLLWGLYHASGLTLFRVFRASIRPRLPTVTALRTPLTLLSILLTQAFVFVGFVFTMNDGPEAILHDLTLLLGIA